MANEETNPAPERKQHWSDESIVDHFARAEGEKERAFSLQILRVAISMLLATECKRMAITQDMIDRATFIIAEGWTLNVETDCMTDRIEITIRNPNGERHA